MHHFSLLHAWKLHFVRDSKQPPLCKGPVRAPSKLCSVRASKQHGCLMTEQTGIPPQKARSRLLDGQQACTASTRAPTLSAAHHVLTPTAPGSNRVTGSAESGSAAQHAQHPYSQCSCCITYRFKLHQLQMVQRVSCKWFRG